MSVLTSVGILVLSALIMAFLQLIPGLFSLFLHYTAGKYSKNKASDLATFFILGVETAVVIFFLSVSAILSPSPAIALVLDSDIFAWVMAAVSLVLGLSLFFCYFRKGPGTKLFISRRVAANLQSKVNSAKTRSDAFLLGLFSTVPEIVFTLPLYFLSAIAVMKLGENPAERAAIIILYALVAVAPLLILHSLSATGRTLADSTRFRFKNKTFFRCFLALFYFLIATLIILGISL